MEKLQLILINRKKQLQKECWSNKIRIDEINNVLKIISENNDE